MANSSIWGTGNFTVAMASITKMSSSAPGSGAWYDFFLGGGGGGVSCKATTLAHLIGLRVQHLLQSIYRNGNAIALYLNGT